MIRFDYLEIEGFLSFGLKQSLQLAQEGLIFVVGENRDDPLAQSNGSGKSALPEAIVWALTGRTMRGLVGEDVVCRHGGQDCVVMLSGSRDAVLWRIERARRKGKHHLEFWHGNQHVSADVKTVQEEIYRILQIRYESLLNAVIFGQGDQWRFTSLNDADRKALFSRFLGFDRLTQAHILAKAKAKQVRDQKIQRALELEHVVQQKKSVAQTYQSVKADFLEAQKQQKEQLRRQIADLQQTTDQRIALQEQKIKTLEESLTHTVKRQAEAVRRAKQAQERSDRVKVQKDSKRRELDKLEVQIGDLDERLEGLSTVESRCRYCGHRVDEKHRQQYQNELQQEKTEVLKMRAMVKADHSQLSAEHQTVEAETRQWLQDAVERSKEQKYLSQQVDEAKAQQVSMREEIQAQLQMWQQQLERKPQPPLTLQKLKSQHTDLVHRSRNIEKELEALLEDLQYAEFWEHGFSDRGLKSLLLDYVMPTLNQHAAQYSSRLMSGLNVRFDAQSLLKSGDLRDQISVQIQNEYGAVGYEGASSGERRKIDIVIAKTFQALEADRLGVGCNVSWWDEVFESLDESSSEAVLALLREETASRSSVFVISHLEWLRPYFSTVLTVVKEHGVSRLVS